MNSLQGKKIDIRSIFVFIQFKIDRIVNSWPNITVTKAGKAWKGQTTLACYKKLVIYCRKMFSEIDTWKQSSVLVAKVTMRSGLAVNVIKLFFFFVHLILGNRLDCLDCFWNLQGKTRSLPKWGTPQRFASRR